MRNLAGASPSAVNCTAGGGRGGGGSGGRSRRSEGSWSGGQRNSREGVLSGPISRDNGIPHIARHLVREVGTPPRWCDTPPPPWYLVSHRYICAIPHFATFCAILVQYHNTCPSSGLPSPPPPKQARKSFAILSLQVSRDTRSIAAGL